jgi:hypothetical protein
MGQYAASERWFTAAAAESRPHSIRDAAVTELQALKSAACQPPSAAMRKDSSSLQASVTYDEALQMKLLASDRIAQRQLALNEADAWCQRFEDQIQPILQASCVRCHQQISDTSSNPNPNPDLDAIHSAVDAISASRQLWQQVATVVQQPSHAGYDRLLSDTDRLRPSALDQQSPTHGAVRGNSGRLG